MAVTPEDRPSTMSYADAVKAFQDAAAASSKSVPSLTYAHEWQKNGVDPVTAQVLQRVVEQMGGQAPNVTVSSAYRPYEYNKQVNGAENSQHIYGKAIDLNLSGYTPQQRQAILGIISSQPEIKGIGVYDKNLNTVHFDTRQGPRVAWGPDYTSGSLKNVMNDYTQPMLTAWLQGQPTVAMRPPIPSMREDLPIQMASLPSGRGMAAGLTPPEPAPFDQYEYESLGFQPPPMEAPDYSRYTSDLSGADYQPQVAQDYTRSTSSLEGADFQPPSQPQVAQDYTRYTSSLAGADIPSIDEDMSYQHPRFSFNEPSAIPTGPYGSELIAQAMLTGDPRLIAQAAKTVEDRATKQVMASVGMNVFGIPAAADKAKAEVEKYLTKTLPTQAPGAVRQFQRLLDLPNSKGILEAIPPEYRDKVNQTFAALPKAPLMDDGLPPPIPEMRRTPQVAQDYTRSTSSLAGADFKSPTSAPLSPEDQAIRDIMSPVGPIGWTARARADAQQPINMNQYDREMRDIYRSNEAEGAPPAPYDQYEYESFGTLPPEQPEPMRPTQSWLPERSWARGVDYPEAPVNPPSNPYSLGDWNWQDEYQPQPQAQSIEPNPPSNPYSLGDWNWQDEYQPRPQAQSGSLSSVQPFDQYEYESLGFVPPPPAPAPFDQYEYESFGTLPPPKAPMKAQDYTRYTSNLVGAGFSPPSAPKPVAPSPPRAQPMPVSFTPPLPTMREDLPQQDNSPQWFQNNEGYWQLPDLNMAEEAEMAERGGIGGRPIKRGGRIKLRDRFARSKR